jgi:hypothetical protein
MNKLKTLLIILFHKQFIKNIKNRLEISKVRGTCEILFSLFKEDDLEHQNHSYYHQQDHSLPLKK